MRRALKSLTFTIVGNCFSRKMRFNDVQNFKFEVPLWIIHTFHKVKARLKIFIPVCIFIFFYCETILALEEQDIQLCTGKGIFFFFCGLPLLRFCVMQSPSCQSSLVRVVQMVTPFNAFFLTSKCSEMAASSVTVFTHQNFL